MKTIPVPAWKLVAVGVTVSLLAGASSAQTAAVKVLTLVNAATGRNASPNFPVAARGSLVTIAGRNLANGTFTATSYPIPTNVEGTEVLFEGIAAPLLKVSPTRVLAQVPVELAETGLVDLVVRTSQGASTPLRVALVPQDPGIFEVDTRGAAVAPLNEIAPGDTIIIMVTGLGTTNPPVPSGEPPPASPTVILEATPLVKVGGQAARVTFASLAADQVGVYEIHAEAPRGLWRPTTEVQLIVPAVIGPPGPGGTNGNVGERGPPGPQGEAGPEGPEGADGPDGPEGPIGADGPVGPDGPQGAAGNDGATGPTGAQGPAGNDGATGPTGAQGPAGNDGATGPPGATGPAGPQGPMGPQGPQGDPGPVSLSEAGTLVTNTPHSTLDFDGGDFNVADNGDGTATVSVVSAATVFGSEFDKAEDSSESQTSSASYVHKLRLTTSSLPNGTYRIGVRYRWRKDQTNQDYKGRAQLNDSTTLFEHVQEPKDAGSDQRNWFYWSGYEILSGVNNIDIDFAGSGAQPNYVADALIELWRVQ